MEGLRALYQVPDYLKDIRLIRGLLIALGIYIGYVSICLVIANVTMRDQHD